MKKSHNINDLPAHVQMRYATGNAIKSRGFVGATVGNKSFTKGDRLPFFNAIAQNERDRAPVRINLKF